MAVRQVIMRCILISEQHEAVQIKSNLPQYQGIVLEEKAISGSTFLEVGFPNEAMANVWLNSVT